MKRKWFFDQFCNLFLLKSVDFFYSVITISPSSISCISMKAEHLTGRTLLRLAVFEFKEGTCRYGYLFHMLLELNVSIKISIFVFFFMNIQEYLAQELNL